MQPNFGNGIASQACRGSRTSLLGRSWRRIRFFSASMPDFGIFTSNTWTPDQLRELMPFKELTAAQQEIFDACKKGDLLKVAAYINQKTNKRTRTSFFSRSNTPTPGWLVQIRDASSQFTPLHAAAMNGHDVIVGILIDADPLQAITRDKKECLPIHLASWNGHASIVKRLLERSPETVDTVNCSMETCLHLAAQHGYAEVIKLLLGARANGYLRNARNDTALDIAARTGHALVCQYLCSFCPELPLQCATDSSQTSEYSRRHSINYPIHSAARYSHIKVLRVLREAGFDIDFVGTEGSALHVACLFGQPEAVMFLIESGINPELRNSDGKTALEMLDALQKIEQQTDITQLLQSRDGWNDCYKLLFDYMQRWEKSNINSSSDSGIDGKDYRRQEERDAVWQPLPANARNIQMGYRSSLGRSAVLPSYPTNALSTLPRNWNSRIASGIAPVPMTCPQYAAKHKSVDRRINTLPFNLSPQRTNVSPKRETILPSCSNVFSPNCAGPNCSKVEKNGASITYNPTCSYENVIKEPSPSLDSSPKLTYQSNSLGGSVGRAYGRNIKIADGTQTLPSTPRLRPSLKGTFSPIAEVQSEDRKSYQHDPTPISFRGAELREDSIGLGTSPCFASRNPQVRESSAPFACSTLERSSSPSMTDTEIAGRAPLAQPEEMTGSTTASILSHSSPEREYRSLSANGVGSVFTNSITVHSTDPYMGAADNLSLDTVNVSISSLSLDGQNNPPSPTTSQRQIFNTLVSNVDISAKLNADNHKGIISPSVTELSDSTVASSCSLPVISQISTSPPSPLSPKKLQSPQKTLGSEISSEVRLRSGVSSQMSNSDYQINEQEEWNEIEGIMSSFGSGICRESVFTTDYENKVASFLRGNKVEAITLHGSMSTANRRKSLDEDEGHMINWLNTCVGLSRPMAEQIGEIIVANGFDKITQLHGSLTKEWMSYLNIDRQSQERILTYLSTVEDRRPKSDHFTYISTWLCSLELLFYLSNFMEAGFGSVVQFQEAMFGFDDYKKKLNINRIGHITRIMQSLEDGQIVTPIRNIRNNRTVRQRESLECEYTPVQKRLLTDEIIFSAHYFGSMEIPYSKNLDNSAGSARNEGSEKSRFVMNKLKKEIRDLADVTQIVMKINMAGVTVVDSKTKNKLFFHPLPSFEIVCQDTRDMNCIAFATKLNRDCYDCHVFSVLTTDLAVELIGVLGQAFNLLDCRLKNQVSSEV